MSRFMAVGCAGALVLGLLSGWGVQAQAEETPVARGRSPAGIVGSPFSLPGGAGVAPLRPWYTLPVDQQPSAAAAARPPVRRATLLSSDPSHARNAMAPGTPAWWSNYYPGTVVPIR